MERKTATSEEMQWQIGIALLIFASLMMILCEGLAIHGLWFRAAPHRSFFKMVAIPLAVAFPTLFGWTFYFQLREWVRTGEMSQGLRARLTSYLGILAALSYLGFAELVDLAF